MMSRLLNMPFIYLFLKYCHIFRASPPFPPRTSRFNGNIECRNFKCFHILCFYLLKRMEQIKAEHSIVGDVRGKGCLFGIELVKDRTTKEPFDKAGELVYQKAFSKGLAWIPAGHILRMSPPIIMEDDVMLKALDMIDEAIGETEKELGHAG